MIESMWSSMTTSLQLAEDCMKKERDISSDSGNQAFEGIESFAHTIDSSTHYFKKYIFLFFKVGNLKKKKILIAYVF